MTEGTGGPTPPDEHWAWQPGSSPTGPDPGWGGPPTGPVDGAAVAGGSDPAEPRADDRPDVPARASDWPPVPSAGTSPLTSWDAPTEGWAPIDASAAGGGGRTPLVPPPPEGGASAFRIAFLAAILSSLLTVAVGAVLLWALQPQLSSAPSPAPSSAVAESPAASAQATPVASPSGVPSPSPVASASAPSQASPAVSSVPAGTPPTSSTAAIVRAALPSVVTITTESTGFGRFGPSTGVGSGIIVDAAGWILTNGHVVDGAGTITVQLSDGRQLPGTVYGMASATDLAIVKVDATGLPALALDSSAGLELGDDVVAIGTPLGDYPGSVTTGIVSGLDRSISIRGLGTLDGLIQTDAAVNPGNSGGPLLDAAGHVVGVTTATTSDAQGISFAIPSDAARPYIEDALAGKPLP
jgi:S1-C subfamily serine protease